MESNNPGTSLFEMLKVIRERSWQYTGSKELAGLKAFIHGYLQALFQNKISEVSFPKYRWFSAWTKGRIDSEFDFSFGWDKHIQSACKGDEAASVELFFKCYEEYVQSEVVCYYQKLNDHKKIFKDAQYGPFWPIMNSSTSELLMFQLLPSPSAWCLFLNEQKEILHTIDAQSRSILIEKIRTQYFAIEEADWTKFDGGFYLKNLIINRVENNY